MSGAEIIAGVGGGEGGGGWLAIPRRLTLRLGTPDLDVETRLLLLADLPGHHVKWA